MEKKYGGLGVPELRRLCQLEEENFKLKQFAADLSLDKQMLQDVIKKVLKPAQLRWLTQSLPDEHRVSVRKVCLFTMLHRSLWRFQSHRRNDSLIRMRMNEIAKTRVRYGF
jgi:putative transposase